MSAHIIRPSFNLCIFCASSIGQNPQHCLTARLLGRLMAEQNIGLMYGGASVGLMGEVANACLQAGGYVEGVIPEDLFTKEVGHEGLHWLYKTRSMHTRKAIMAERSSAFVALPGGFGTLDELFEILTWSQLGIHHKPIGLLNVDGYYDALLQFLQHAVREGLLNPLHLARLRVYTELQELLDGLRTAAPDDLTVSWMGPGQG